MGVDPGPELEEDPGHGAVTSAGGLHQRGVTILIVILEHGVRSASYVMCRIDKIKCQPWIQERATHLNMCSSLKEVSDHVIVASGACANHFLIKLFSLNPLVLWVRIRPRHVLFRSGAWEKHLLDIHLTLKYPVIFASLIFLDPPSIRQAVSLSLRLKQRILAFPSG